jgi:hypothetical protein
VREPAHRRRRRKLPDVGRAINQRCKATVDRVIGVLKGQRGLRRFRLRSLRKVGIELTPSVPDYSYLQSYFEHDGPRNPPLRAARDDLTLEISP